MPISADHFKSINGGHGGSNPGTNAYEILSFLEQHADKAFTQSEIIEETSVTAGSVGPTLGRLRDRGRVEHKGTYWRVSDHTQSLTAAVAHADAVAASHEDDPFDYDEWQEYAVDPRETRE